ncbi:hypothetical protein Thermo_01789 [Thermoplasmatales archaeon]|nr:hypothetical protein Thermo_01789 [Thermoplasmatales archaeon]
MKQIVKLAKKRVNYTKRKWGLIKIWRDAETFNFTLKIKVILPSIVRQRLRSIIRILKHSAYEYIGSGAKFKEECSNASQSRN